ncbi:MAG: pirin family protein [bacterium]
MRRVVRTIVPQKLVEGAGVRVKRTIGGPDLDHHDPFLLLDHFDSQDPADYEAGFPMHPHRGIETVTYMLAGEVHHRDTLGNAGSIGAGDLQWMTSGRGIMHEEMPQPRAEGNRGFQLWVNLPARLKMSAPRYQDVRASNVPVVTHVDGATVRVLAGAFEGTEGPISGIAAAPTYLDVTLASHAAIEAPVPAGHAAFVYLFEGECEVGGTLLHAPILGILGHGERVRAARVGNAGPARFLLVSAAPLGEPIARYGPFVMNTREEIAQALEDLRRGTFV